MIDRRRRIEKQRIRLDRVAALAAHGGVRDHRRRFHHEAKVARDLLGVARVFGDGQRLVERAIDADAAKQRMPRVGAQPMPRQLRLGVVGIAAPDQTAPTGEEPRRCAEMNAARQQPTESRY